MHKLPRRTNAVSPFQANSVLVKQKSIYILEDTSVHIPLLWPFCLFFSLYPFYLFTMKQKCFIHSNSLLIRGVIFKEGIFHRLFIGWSNSAFNKKNSHYYRVFLTVCRLQYVEYNFKKIENYIHVAEVDKRPEFVSKFSKRTDNFQLQRN